METDTSVRTQGPSGAGKSTLLQLIAGRHIDPGLLAGFDVAGQVLFNGQSVPPRNTRGLVSFVEQDDLHHLPALTVRETLRYAASESCATTAEDQSHAIRSAR